MDYVCLLLMLIWMRWWGGSEVYGLVQKDGFKIVVVSDIVVHIHVYTANISTCSIVALFMYI